MRYTKCTAYNPNYETVKKIIGHSSNGPIYHEQELLVNEYCSMMNSYDFDCETCPVYKAYKRSLNEKK